jgi:NAD(P)-dependent dehydrogenase (short-subunit alcohol dehydrogenase family)
MVLILKGTPMSRIFITSSSDGLGLMAARLLVGDGHRVTLHARNEARSADTRHSLSRAEAVVAGDLSSIAEMRRVGVLP